MTRYEAINFGKRVLSLRLFDKTHEFCELAVKALEQQPCEDAISRTDAIRVASGYCHWSNIPAELAKLPSVNPQPCEDAISRKQALDAFGLSEKTRKYGGDHSGYNTMMLYEIQDVIEGLPSVSTEKTGHWEWVQYDFDPRIGNWHCSECRNIVFQGVEKKGIHEKSIYKYCPWCGAKMGAEE